MQSRAGDPSIAQVENLQTGTLGAVDEDKLYKKLFWRIAPLAVLGYVIAYIDRVNVGFAKLQFLQDLGFSDTVFGLGAGLFFAGYFLFEVPSNLLLEKMGARLTLTRIMVLWGLLSAGMALVQTPMQFYAMRFLLGAAEAGFFPGIILYLSDWFPEARRGRITAFFTMGASIAGIVGGPLSGWLMSLDGLHGLGADHSCVYAEGGCPCLMHLTALHQARPCRGLLRSERLLLTFLRCDRTSWPWPRSTPTVCCWCGFETARAGRAWVKRQ